ncbi:MSMEG_0570 family nitrogen starvation response protein [Methylobacterium sp. J-001]|uniref:MSMEG_0570 family nitrogen starvation response protein n=1 Tax=Methylobacterium sp. J-001 TaxID=2836609 RepID=UPI001FBBF6C7|nr:MSMEG_0570 family nitrogen starvation response protein [Methylobacterium sp. J-001]MCJ2120935.1 MSMEG_0570 family nitrogen starvation response protein [Methylobacterium sp. J-001]
MPEMRFHIRWPDGSRDACYSPTLVIKQHLAVGQDYALDEFLALTRLALGSASARVQERYGFPCGRAEAQLARIEETARRQEPGTVHVEAFEE